MDVYGPEAWYGSLPRITKTIITLMFLLTVCTTFRIVSPQSLMLNWQLIRKHFEVHRILLGCLYAGQFSFKWAIQTYMFSQFSSTLERNPLFANSIGGYLYFILIQMFLISVISLFFFWPTGFPMLNDALLFSVLYYWSRRDMWNNVSVYVFTVKAYQLPYVMLFVNFIMGAPMVVNIIGMLAAHAYYVVREILPTKGFKNYFSRSPHWVDYIADKIDALFEYARLTWNQNVRPASFSSPPPRTPERNSRYGFVGRGIRLGSS
ncbi:DER1 [Babesia ovis]|uniref:Derlin n=1 Tax=Babesia ovis TaxID=5869 RepID=A0A9W5T8S6_BABOV|nr:DER1 [Babesia ovis]